MQANPEIIRLLTTPQRIVITTHMSPDGDAIGSSLGLKHCLENAGHVCQVIIPDSAPAFLQWMPGYDSVCDFSKQPENAQTYITEAALIFCLDFNTLSRINLLGEHIARAQGIKILIDHHRDPEDFAAYNYVDITACATAQLVLTFLSAHHFQQHLDARTATCLYAGILTDSGSFRFPSTNATVMRMAAELIELGADNAAIFDAIYDNYSVNRMQLLGYALQEKMEVFSNSHAACMGLSAAELAQFKFQKGDTEGLVNYPLSIKGITVSVLVLEKDNTVKLSLRSKGNFSVNDLARKHFLGGGHLNAAGATSDLSYTDTMQKVRDILSKLED